MNCIALFVEENVLALLQIQHSLFLFSMVSIFPRMVLFLAVMYGQVSVL